MRYGWMVGLMMAGQAAAQDVVASNCQNADWLGENYRFAAVVCDITNNGSVPVASIRYGGAFTEEGRTVPWAVISNGREDYREIAIGGGIELGETVNQVLDGATVPGRANPERVIIAITILEAFDVNGEPIATH